MCVRAGEGGAVDGQETREDLPGMQEAEGGRWAKAGEQGKWLESR